MESSDIYLGKKTVWLLKPKKSVNLDEVQSNNEITVKLKRDGESGIKTRLQSNHKETLIKKFGDVGFYYVNSNPRSYILRVVNEKDWAAAVYFPTKPTRKCIRKYLSSFLNKK